MTKCPVDIRSEVLSSVLLVGGGSMIPGMHQRLKWEVQALATESLSCLSQFNYILPDFAGNIVSWVGASLYSSLHVPNNSFKVERQSFFDNGKVQDWSQR